MEKLLNAKNRRGKYKGRVFNSKSEDQSKASQNRRNQISELSSQLLGFDSGQVFEADENDAYVDWRKSTIKNKRIMLKKVKVKSEVDAPNPDQFTPSEKAEGFSFNNYPTNLGSVGSAEKEDKMSKFARKQTSEHNNGYSEILSKNSHGNTLSTSSALGMGKKVKSAISHQSQTLMGVKNAYETSIEQEIAAIKNSFKRPNKKKIAIEKSEYVRVDSLSDNDSPKQKLSRRSSDGTNSSFYENMPRIVVQDLDDQTVPHIVVESTPNIARAKTFTSNLNVQTADTLTEFLGILG